MYIHITKYPLLGRGGFWSILFILCIRYEWEGGNGPYSFQKYSSHTKFHHFWVHTISSYLYPYVLLREIGRNILRLFKIVSIYSYFICLISNC